MRHHTLTDLAHHGRYMPSGEDLAIHAYIDTMPEPGGVYSTVQNALAGDLFQALEDAEAERLTADQIQEDADEWERQFLAEESAHRETEAERIRLAEELEETKDELEETKDELEEN